MIATGTGLHGGLSFWFLFTAEQSSSFFLESVQLSYVDCLFLSYCSCFVSSVGPTAGERIPAGDLRGGCSALCYLDGLDHLLQ